MIPRDDLKAKIKNIDKLLSTVCTVENSLHFMDIPSHLTGEWNVIKNIGTTAFENIDALKISVLGRTDGSVTPRKVFNP
jgi:hypothetical protein